MEKVLQKIMRQRSAVAKFSGHFLVNTGRSVVNAHTTPKKSR